MGYNPNIPHLQAGYNPLTNHLLASWDIQAQVGFVNAFVHVGKKSRSWGWRVGENPEKTVEIRIEKQELGSSPYQTG